MIYYGVFVLNARFCVESVTEMFSVCEGADTRLMLWTMWRSYIIKKTGFETETEEYMVQIVSYIYGK